MTKRDTASSKKLTLEKARAHYEYGFYEQPIITHTKDGRLFYGTTTQWLEEVKENPKDWNYTKWDTIMPAVCMCMGILLLIFIIASGLR